MNEHVYKIIELAGSSTKSIEDAIENAVQRTSSTIHNMRWLQVQDTRAHIEGNKISHWQVIVKIGFTLDE